MVCDKCEKKGKLGKSATAQVWKSGSSSSSSGSGSTSAGRAVGENKLLSSKKSRYNPYTESFKKCKICKTKVHQTAAHYCQACAYKKAICAMCGVKIMKTKNYKQSST